jgi:hypothetical protein
MGFIMMIKLIRRDKFPNIHHYGVELPDGRCIELSPTKGIRFCTMPDFSAGKQVVIEKTIPYTTFAYNRLIELIDGNKKYDLVNFNCEHFARYLTEGKAESFQVRDTFIVLACIVGIVVLARS